METNLPFGWVPTHLHIIELIEYAACVQCVVNNSGTAGAHTPCHYDTYGCNLVAQVSGKKRWILYPPEDTPLLEPSRIPYEESSVYSQINFQRWKETEVPDISGSHPHVVILYPGDVLFVPRHWWHYVHNVQLSISINTWLERPEDEEARLAEGLVKYFMANISRNISPDLSSTLLNPNEVCNPWLTIIDF